MRDIFPVAAPAPLVALVKPLADTFQLATLPIHAHEVLFAFTLYTTIFTVVSPFLSTLHPAIAAKYRKFNDRTRLSWNVHVVSFFQSVIICTLSLYIILFDEERKTWRGEDQWAERIWGYSGLSGLCQSFALGYFLWDFVMCTWRVDIFGWGMLAHAVSAVSVFALGYRPFLYYYCPVFLLYELSSPFLNIHWFCDKLDLTGSVYQAVNGALLTSTFFCCRIVWGQYSSYNAFHDMYTAIRAGHSTPPILTSDKFNHRSDDLALPFAPDKTQTQAFMTHRHLPLWLAITYLISNLTLNLLNLFWFSKMIATIRKRFDPPWGTKGQGPDVVHYLPAEREKKQDGQMSATAAKLDPSKPKGSVKAARQRAEAAVGVTADGNGGLAEEAAKVQRGVYADGHTSIEVSGSTATPGRTSARSRRKA